MGDLEDMQRMSDQLDQYAADLNKKDAELERLTEIADTNYSKWKEQVERTRKLLARVEELEGVLIQIATKEPINKEYGNQGVDADQMMCLARVATEQK